MSKKYRKKIDENGEEYFEEEVSGAEALQGCGSAMSGCGCLLTLLVTIPIILLILALF